MQIVFEQQLDAVAVAKVEQVVERAHRLRFDGLEGAHRHEIRHVRRCDRPAFNGPRAHWRGVGARLGIRDLLNGLEGLLIGRGFGGSDNGFAALDRPSILAIDPWD